MPSTQISPFSLQALAAQYCKVMAPLHRWAKYQFKYPYSEGQKSHVPQGQISEWKPGQLSLLQSSANSGPQPTHVEQLSPHTFLMSSQNRILSCENVNTVSPGLPGGTCPSILKACSKLPVLLRKSLPFSGACWPVWSSGPLDHDSPAMKWFRDSTCVLCMCTI